MTEAKLRWCGLAAGILFSGLVAAAWAIAAFHWDAARLVFHGLCHQIPGRCFHADGGAWAVCVRCVGIYAGLAAGSFAFAIRPYFLPRAGAVLVGALLANGMEFFFEHGLGLGQSFAGRLIAGCVLGGAIAALAYRHFKEPNGVPAGEDWF